MSTRIFTSVVVFLIMSGSFFYTELAAQHRSISTNLRSAEKRATALFDKGAYTEAIEMYQRVLEKNPQHEEARLIIATCYTKLNEPEQAVVWYAQALQHNDRIAPIHQLQYAQALASTEDYEKASTWFEKYLRTVPNDRRAKFQLEAIAHLDTFYKDSASYQISRLSLNSAYSDFGPIFYQKGLAFISARQTKTSLNYVSVADQGAFFDLYYSELDTNEVLSSPVKMSHILNTKYHEGPATFFHDEQSIIFNRNNAEVSADKKNKTLKLFEARKSKNNTWVDINPLPFNSNEYSVAHPAISNDGNLLYFASDMPGGYGQSDLYVSQRINDQWTAPKNLGPAINTEGDEMFPFLLDDMLYFASNGLGGLGGLDVFSMDTKQIDGVPQNMGVPLNSSHDDFGFILNEKNTGYFSSNRIQGYKDDLFWIKIKPNADNDSPVALVDVAPATVRLKGHIYDKKTNQPLPDAQIYIMDEATGEEADATSDNHGNFTFEARMEDMYAIMGEKEDKNVFVFNIQPGDFAGRADSILLAAETPFALKKLVIEVTLFDSLTKEAAKLAAISLSENTDVLQTEFSSMEGKIYFIGYRGKQYWLDILSVNYEDKKVAISTDVSATQDTLSIPIPLRKMKRKPSIVQAGIYDRNTQEPIANAEIYILNATTGQDETLYADEHGEFAFEATSGDVCALMGEKDDMHAFLPNVTIQSSGETSREKIQLLASSLKPKKETLIEISVADSVTLLPLRLVAIYLSKNDKEQRAFTSSSGKAYFNISDPLSFAIRTHLQEYKDTLVEVVARPDFAGDTMRISLTLHKAKPDFLVTRGHVYDGESGQPVEHASVNVINERTGEEQNLHSDTNGDFSFEVNHSDSYAIMSEKGDKSAFILNLSFNEPDKTNYPVITMALEGIFFENTGSQQAIIAMKVVDQQTKEPVKLAHINISEDSKNVKFAFTTTNGTALFSLDSDKKFALAVDKKYYASQSVTVSTLAKTDTIAVLVQLVEEKPTVVSITGNIYDLQEKESLTNTDIYVLDMQTGKQTELKADEQGNFSMKVNPEHHYMVVGEKDDRTALLADIKTQDDAGEIPQKMQLHVQPPKPVRYIVAITVLDSISEAPVKAATLKVEDDNHEQITYYTSLKGKSNIKATADKHYLLGISATGFREKSIRLSTEPLAGTDTITATVLLQRAAPLQKNQHMVVYHTKTKKPLPKAKIYVVNKRTGEEQTLIANEKGEVVYPVRVGDTLSVLAAKDNFRAILPNLAINDRAESDTLRIQASSVIPEETFMQVIVKDETTHEPIKFSKISLSKNIQETRQLFTTSYGSALFSVVSGEQYTLRTSHINYEDTTSIISADPQQDTIRVVLFLKKLQPVYTTLTARIIDDSTRQPVPYAEVVVLNETTGEKQRFLADEHGKLLLKAKYADSYTISTHMVSHKDAKITGVKAVQEFGTISKEVQLVIKKTDTKQEPAFTADHIEVIDVRSGKNQLYVFTRGNLYEYVSDDKVSMLKSKTENKVLPHPSNNAVQNTLYDRFISTITPASVDAITSIKNIPFNFDQHGLTDTTKQALDKVAGVMKKHADFTLVIHAFADSQGAKAYNKSLSQKRADTVYKYLLSQGVENTRIATESFGANNLLQPCAIPGNCTQQEHQINRRVEFILNIP